MIRSGRGADSAAELAGTLHRPSFGWRQRPRHPSGTDHHERRGRARRRRERAKDRIEFPVPVFPPLLTHQRQRGCVQHVIRRPGIGLAVSAGSAGKQRPQAAFQMRNWRSSRPKLKLQELGLAASRRGTFSRAGLLKGCTSGREISAAAPIYRPDSDPPRVVDKATATFPCTCGIHGAARYASECRESCGAAEMACCKADPPRRSRSADGLNCPWSGSMRTNTPLRDTSTRPSGPSRNRASGDSSADGHGQRIRGSDLANNNFGPRTLTLYNTLCCSFVRVSGPSR